MNRRGKLLALSTVAVGLVVLVGAGILSKDRILEKWYLRQLKRGDEKARDDALVELAKVGSEESLLEITEAYDVMRFTPVWAVGERSGLAGEVVRQISERIGDSREMVAKLRYMGGPGGQQKTRVSFALAVIGATADREVLLSSFAIGVAPYPLSLLREFSSEVIRKSIDAKPAAIAVATQALSSQDSCCREIAAIAPSVCGPEAKPAVPALKAVLSDPDELVSRSAAEALKRIQGTRDETER